MPAIATYEDFYGRGIAKRISAVRCVLAAANLGVILLDHTVPIQKSVAALNIALLVGGFFLAYALLVRLLLVRRLLGLSQYGVATAVLDVAFAGLLVISTDGYLSPFTLWFVFAVVSSGFTPHRWLPHMTTILALLAHSMIATIPQERPLDLAVFIVRTLYLFGFAATVASVGSYLTRQSAAISEIGLLGTRLAEARDLRSASEMLFDAFSRSLWCTWLAVRIESFEEIMLGERSAAPDLTLPLHSDGKDIGTVSIGCQQALRRDEEAMARILLDRFAATVRRLELVDQLVEAASAEERLRLADRLHDGFIQAVAAIDMHAQVAKELVRREPNQAYQEMDTIKVLARDAALEARSFLLLPEGSSSSSLDTVQQVLDRRWTDRYEVDVDPALELGEQQWRLVEMLAREGSNNAKRHGQATKVRLELKVVGREVHATLRSNGKAPDPSTQFGYGLSRLASILEPLGGEVCLERHDEGGAVVSARFPKEMKE